MNGLLNALTEALRGIGTQTVDGVWRLGFAARFFLEVLRCSGQSFRRLPLTIREIYFSGVLSLLIILVSGLFVGLVLGLQGSGPGRKPSFPEGGPAKASGMGPNTPSWRSG